MTTIEPCPVTIFDDGGVNLDGETADDLMKFWAWRGASGATRRNAARALFPDRPPRYVSVTGDLGGYAANKAAAIRCRERGDIPAAMVYENICDRIYADLPDWAKW